MDRVPAPCASAEDIVAIAAVPLGGRRTGREPDRAKSPPAGSVPGRGVAHVVVRTAGLVQ